MVTRGHAGADPCLSGDDGGINAAEFSLTYTKRSLFSPGFTTTCAAVNRNERAFTRELVPLDEALVGGKEEDEGEGGLGTAAGTGGAGF